MYKAEKALVCFDEVEAYLAAEGSVTSCVQFDDKTFVGHKMNDTMYKTFDKNGNSLFIVGDSFNFSKIGEF